MSRESQRATPSARQVAAICALLFVLVVLVFGQTVFHDFINFDDDDYVYNNPSVARGLTAPGILWAFTRAHSANWHPLTWVSHMLDIQAYGLNASGHHLTSVLLHAATSALLFLALRLMTGNLWAGAFAAALFAVHPLHVESVAWIAERKDILSGLFFTLTLLAYLGYVRRTPSHARLLGVAALLAAGLMSKPMLVTVPLLLLVLDVWPLGRARGWAGLLPLLREKIPLLALSAASSALTLWAQQEALMPGERLPLAWRLGNALVACAAYVGKSIFPVNLAIFYPHPGLKLQPWQLAAASAGLLGVTGMAIAAWRRHPHLIVGWVWFVGMLMPVIGIVQVGEQAMADRYVYLPQIGLCLAVACAAGAAGRTRALRRGICASAVASLALLMGITWRQTGYWRDGETLFTHALSVTTGNYVAHNNLGILRAEAGRNDEAAAHFREALAIKPLYPDALANLGMTAAASGSIDEAIAAYRKVLTLNPRHPGALTNLGVALAQRGAPEEAIAAYRQVLSQDPDHLEALTNLGVALARRGALDEAVAAYRHVLALDPDNLEALTNLGVALAAGGAHVEAIAAYRKALAEHPGNRDARYNLGVALAQRGALDEAIAEYRRVLATSPEYADAHFNLGVALEQRGSIEEAIAHFRRAAALRPDWAAALTSLGAALLKRGDTDGAIAEYRRALAVDPRYAFAHINLGVALVQRGRTDEAIAHYRAAVGLDPDLLEAHFNLAGLLAQRGQLEEAAAHRRQAMALAARQGRADLLESLRQAAAKDEAATTTRGTSTSAERAPARPGRR